MRDCFVWTCSFMGVNYIDYIDIVRYDKYKEKEYKVESNVFRVGRVFWVYNL